MATGESFRAMTYHFMRGLTTISNIVSDTTENIWTVLHPEYLGSPTQEKWIQISNRFYELWNIPNCLGAIDGKHFRIKCLPNTGSTYFNYKSYFSIVLMACVDADGLFTTIDVGEVGRNSDGAVFRTSNLGRALSSGVLQLPPSRPLPSSNDGNDFPFYFVADEAFPLKKYLMRPYSKRSLDNKKRVFNYRLSRGRKSVECAFGMLVSKFRLFEGPICCKEETINCIIKTACVLHNFIRIKQGIFTHPKQFEKQQENSQISNTQVQQIIRPLSEAQQNREKLCDYFMSPAGSIPYQWNTII